MEENKLATEQETKKNEIVELKDEELATITAGSKDQVLEPNEIGYDKNLKKYLKEHPKSKFSDTQ